MTDELKRRFLLSDEQVAQMREWHAKYEAADDLDACLRGYGALVAEKDAEIARLTADRDLWVERASAWNADNIKRLRESRCDWDCESCHAHCEEEERPCGSGCTVAPTHAFRFDGRINSCADYGLHGVRCGLTMRDPVHGAATHEFVEDSHFRSCWACDRRREDPIHR